MLVMESWNKRMGITSPRSQLVNQEGMSQWVTNFMVIVSAWPKFHSVLTQCWLADRKRTWHEAWGTLQIIPLKWLLLVVVCIINVHFCFYTGTLILQVFWVGESCHFQVTSGCRLKWQPSCVYPSSDGSYVCMYEYSRVCRKHFFSVF